MGFATAVKLPNFSHTTNQVVDALAFPVILAKNVQTTQ